MSGFTLTAVIVVCVTILVVALAAASCVQECFRIVYGGPDGKETEASAQAQRQVI